MRIKLMLNSLTNFPLSILVMQKKITEPNENFILELLANATIERIDKNKPSFLFHSAGKDSNTIALSLAEAGWQNKVTLITHKSKGNADESEISSKIAKNLVSNIKYYSKLKNLKVIINN